MQILLQKYEQLGYNQETAAAAEGASLDGSSMQTLGELDYNEIECFKEFGDSRFLQTLDCFERDGAGALVNVERVARGVLVDLTRLLTQSTDDSGRFSLIS